MRLPRAKFFSSHRRSLLHGACGSLFTLSGILMVVQVHGPPEVEEWDAIDNQNPSLDAGAYGSTSTGTSSSVTYMSQPESSGQRHHGENGRMGVPARNRPGLYAMKAAKNVIPGMNAGYSLGSLSQQSGHYPASPFGGTFQVGDDNEDVWGGLSGTEIGEAYGLAGLGIVGTGRGGGGFGEAYRSSASGKGAKGSGSGGEPASGYGRGSGAGFGGRGTRVPRVRQGIPTIITDADQGLSRSNVTRPNKGLADHKNSPKHRAQLARQKREQQARDQEVKLAMIAAQRQAERAAAAAQQRRDEMLVVLGQRWQQQMIATSADPLSTFSIDVDTASHSYVRRLVEEGSLPSPSEVRVEEMINYFDYDYPLPPTGVPVLATSEVGPCPWNAANKLIHVGVQADIVEQGEVPARNLVFLVDVSGSMGSPDRLPLLQQALTMMVPTFVAQDRISMVVYAGAAGQVLAPTSGSDSASILSALERLTGGGSTNGGEGIELAYKLATKSFIRGGVNRVILATDGDFNVGTTGHDQLVQLIAAKRETGVYLSVLRFGAGSGSDSTMEQLADQGNGNYAYIDRLAEAHKVLVEQAGGTLVPVADDVKIQVEFDPHAVKSYRLLGYHNRRLAHRDFADDRKDAGEIGSGHTVTAIYEVQPQPAAKEVGDETLMTLRLRYKHPGQSESQVIEQQVHDRELPLSQTSDAFRFSAAVAQYGELLSGHRFPDGGFDQVVRLATQARGTDARCHRADFVALAARAGSLADAAALVDHVTIACTPREPAPRERAVAAARRPQISSAFMQALSQPFSPFELVASWLELLATILRPMPTWFCILPALLGGFLLGISRRWEVAGADRHRLVK